MVARAQMWTAHSVLSRVPLSATPGPAARQAPLSTGSQARILEWGAISFPKMYNRKAESVSHITREGLGWPLMALTRSQDKMKGRLYEQEEGRKRKAEKRRKGGKAQPLVEDAHGGQYTPDMRTNLCDWTCKTKTCRFGSLKVQDLKVFMPGFTVVQSAKSFCFFKEKKKKRYLLWTECLYPPQIYIPKLFSLRDGF